MAGYSLYNSTKGVSRNCNHSDMYSKKTAGGNGDKQSECL